MCRFLFTFWLLPKYGLCCGNVKTTNYNIVLGNISRLIETESVGTMKDCNYLPKCRVPFPIIDVLLIFFILSFEFVMHFSLRNRKMEPTSMGVGK